MKNLLVTISIVGMMVCLAFKYPIAMQDSHNTNNQRTLNKPNRFGPWGLWKTTGCYRGLDFRVRRTQEDSFNGEKYEWEVQFRNRYADVINFNFKITYPGDDSEPGGRMSLDANNTSNGEDWGLVEASERCQISVAKVRFGEDDGAKPYVECGH